MDDKDVLTTDFNYILKEDEIIDVWLEIMTTLFGESRRLHGRGRIADEPYRMSQIWGVGLYEVHGKQRD